MRLISLIAVLLLAACTTQQPQISTYLLRSEVAPTAGTKLAKSAVALGTIRVADYIQQPGLVLETGDGKIQAARNHTWAEPLLISLRRFLATEISAAAGSDISANLESNSATRVNVTIDQLHGNSQGVAILVAYWEIETGTDSASYRFSEQLALAGDGYDPLVRAEEALLKQLAVAIAGSLPPG